MATECPGQYSTLDMRVRAVAAVERGVPVGQVAESFGVDRTTIFRWMTRHSENAIDGLHRKSGSGRPRLLANLDDTSLLEIVLSPATDFGFETDLWTIGRLHHVVQEKYDTVISPDTIGRRVRDAGLTYQKPERQYFQGVRSGHCARNSVKSCGLRGG